MAEEAVTGIFRKSSLNDVSDIEKNSIANPASFGNRGHERTACPQRYAPGNIPGAI